MALWGITDADESKPKWLTTAQKKEIYANNSGWVVEGGSAQTGNDNADAQPEVLCCVGDLATAVGSADIGEVEWITTTADKSDGFTLSVRIRWNELVTVDTSGGTPTISITNGNQGASSGRGPHLANYLSGSTTNELTFRCTIGAANAATNADDILVIGTNATALNSGTIKDTGEGTVAVITNTSAQGTAAGSITVAA